MVLRPLVAVAFLVVSSGCDGEQPLAQANVERLKVDPLALEVRLLMRLEPPCSLLSGVTATQDGVPLRQRSPARRVQGVYLDIPVPSGPAVCEGPVWEMFPVLAPTSVTVVVEDPSAKMTAELRDVRPDHGGFRVVAPASGIAHPGEVVTVEWSPTNDVLFTTDFSGTITLPMSSGNVFIFGPTTDNGVTSNPNQVSTQGSRVSFTLPGAGSFNAFGPSELTLVMNADRGFERCEGVPVCTSPFRAMVGDGKLPLTIDP